MANGRSRKARFPCGSCRLDCDDDCLLCEDGKTDVIANDLGDRTTPCVVAFTDHDQAVGMAAKQGIIRNVQNTVCHVKQVLGRKCEHPAVTDYRKKSAVTVIDKSGDPVFEVDYKESRRIFTPTEIAVSIFKKMLETAQSHGGSGIQDSVLAVPLNFSQEQKRAVSYVATQAGFNMLRLIAEPVAAVLAYDIGQTDVNTHSTVLVFRLGGISADASVVRVENGMYSIAASTTDTTLGGDRFTEALSSLLISEFQRLYRHDIKDNKRSVAKLVRAAENCKHTLSKLDNAHCAVDSLYDGVDFNTNVSRARYESVVGELVQNCIQLIDQLLTSCHVTSDAIDTVILSGGGASAPVIQKAAGDRFPKADLLTSISSEAVIARGAAKQGSILAGLEDDDIKLNAADTQLDCLARAICIKNAGDNGTIFTPVFPKLSPLHSRKHLDFVLGEHQTSFVLEICELDDSQAEPSSVTIAKVVMRDLPAGAKIATTFHLRRDGSVHITCVESTTNRTESVSVDGS